MLTITVLIMLVSFWRSWKLARLRERWQKAHKLARVRRGMDLASTPGKEKR